VPHLEIKNFTHTVPEPANIIYRTLDANERALEDYEQRKVSDKSREIENSLKKHSY
jgi:hypothetical protein